MQNYWMLKQAVRIVTTGLNDADQIETLQLVQHKRRKNDQWRECDKMLQTDVLDAEAPVPQPLSKERTA
jgi:hypothetical protein